MLSLINTNNLQKKNMNINEILAKQIVDKLLAEKLISSENILFANKLANGSIKESDWKIALEAIIDTTKKNIDSKNETE